MLSLAELLNKTGGKGKIYKDMNLQAEGILTEKLTVCIPDMHLLEKGNTDDFCREHPEYEARFLDFLDFLLGLKDTEQENLEIIHVGDLYDLWQARGNSNLVQEAYTSILGILDNLNTVYVVGNHDIDFLHWYEDMGETFGRKWRYFSTVDGNQRVLYEHGFQADFWNNQGSWSGTIGKNITIIVGMAEMLYPDTDVFMENAWEDLKRIFDVFNGGLTPVKNPAGFNTHEYLGYYIDRMKKYNRGDTDDHHGPAKLALTVVGHTHSARMVQKPQDDGRTYYLMDCGSWVNGGHEFGVISGKDLAVCQWG